MKIGMLTARLLLGLMFSVFGLNGFLHFIPTTMPAGPAGEFIGAMFASHYAYFVFGVQIIAGVLPGILATVLCLVIAYRVRAAFIPLLAKITA